MDTRNRHQALRRYALLATATVIVAAVVLAIAMVSRERIDANQRAWFIARLDALIPPMLHDNDLYDDRILVLDPDLLGSGTKMPIYRARNAGKPCGAILTAIAPDGYGGPIELLIAVDYEGAVLGVDILRHSETQGIGDGFRPDRSNWLQSLIGKTLDNTPRPRWTIRKDGGDFDQFTGASVTPRAILKAVRNALEYYTRRRDEIFTQASIDADRTTH
jgi:electron transport complex protein RnfG